MRSPLRKPTANGSSKSSFHFKTPDGAGTSPAPPFSFPAPQQKAGIPGEAKEDILSVPAGGSSHYGARGRSLWRKAPSPLDPHPKHGGRHPSPIPPRGTKGRDCGPSPLETPPGDEGRGRKNQPPRGRRTRDEDKTGNELRVRSEAERTGVEIRRFGFPPRCTPHSQMRGYADLIFGYSAAGRRLPDFVGSA